LAATVQSSRRFSAARSGIGGGRDGGWRRGKLVKGLKQIADATAEFTKAHYDEAPAISIAGAFAGQ
jgi:hypothetical protein